MPLKPITVLQQIEAVCCLLDVDWVADSANAKDPLARDLKLHGLCFNLGCLRHICARIGAQVTAVLQTCTDEPDGIGARLRYESAWLEGVSSSAQFRAALFNNPN